MTLYYRGPTAHITDELLEVWSPHHQVFRIGDLESVYVVPGAGPSTGAVPLLATAGAVAFAVAMLVRSVWVAGLVLVVLLVLAFLVRPFFLAAGLGPAPRPYELRAIHDGIDVLLFRSLDARTFGQVRRALVRAMERRAEREWRARY